MQTTVKHLAIIMDGNRRWAKREGQSAYKGHQAGVLALDKVIGGCRKRGIKYLTVYGFSTENWGRTQSEVKQLIAVLEAAIKKYTDLLNKENWQLRVIGRPKDFPKSTQSLLAKSMNQLRDNQSGVLTLALSYGGRDEILRAVAKAKLSSSKLTEKDFSELLDTKGMPDPDLIIRTGGQTRLSNFLLWQSSYSELYFVPTLWPDFSNRHLDQALTEYTKRKRNFGK
ncbi:MAG: polyprenyl diphosphate synthase [Patescibacteria group bacterium]